MYRKNYARTPAIVIMFFAVKYQPGNLIHVRQMLLHLRRENHTIASIT